MKFDDMLYGMTTLIETHIGSYVSQGSGFFYNALGEKDPSKDSQWVKVEGTWLVTNRHVALPRINDTEIIPDTFTFNLRQIVNAEIQWLPITLSKDEYLRRLKVHSNSIVDVVVIDVGDLIVEQIQVIQISKLCKRGYVGDVIGSQIQLSQINQLYDRS